MKQFIVETDENHICPCLNGDELYCSPTVRYCDGDLNNRPPWCPLREAKLVGTVVKGETGATYRVEHTTGQIVYEPR